MIDEIEDELFRFARIARREPRAAPGARRPGNPLAARVGAGRRSARGPRCWPATLRLVTLRAAGRPHPGPRRHARVARRARRRGARAARRRGALGGRARRRPSTSALAAALERTVERPVEVRVQIDPSVSGGMLVAVGEPRRSTAPSRLRLERLARRARPVDAEQSPRRRGQRTHGLSSRSTPTTSPRRWRATSATSRPRSRPSRSAASPRSATASPTSPGLPGATVNELLEFENGTVGLALNLDEESIGAVVLGDDGGPRRGAGGSLDRQDPLGAGRRRAAGPRREPPR